MLLEQLKIFAAEKAENRTVSDVRIGLCYSAVLLDDGSAGVAYTFRNELAYGCDVFHGSRPLAGKPAPETLAFLTSGDLICRAVGIATANALINCQQPGLVGGDITGLLAAGKNDRVGMVGYFRPLVPRLKKMVKELLIFEKIPEKGEGVYPEQSALELLPTCSIAIITATALINGTLERLLETSRNCRQIALLGATTPLAPEVFKSSGVTLLSGILITDPRGILAAASEGGGVGAFKGHMQKVNCVL